MLSPLLDGFWSLSSAQAAAEPVEIVVTGRAIEKVEAARLRDAVVLDQTSIDRPAGRWRGPWPVSVRLANDAAVENLFDAQVESGLAATIRSSAPSRAQSGSGLPCADALGI